MIGRPINFQGAGGEEENRNALAMLVEAALRAGFADVEFLFEPMAAAMEYEGAPRPRRMRAGARHWRRHYRLLVRASRSAIDASRSNATPTSSGTPESGSAATITINCWHFAP